MLIAVDPDDLERLETVLRTAGRACRDDAERLRGVYAGMSWDVRQEVRIEAQVGQAVELAGSIADGADRLAEFVGRKRAAFLQADGQEGGGFGGLAGAGVGVALGGGGFGVGAALQAIMGSVPGTLIPDSAWSALGIGSDLGERARGLAKLVQGWRQLGAARYINPSLTGYRALADEMGLDLGRPGYRLDVPANLASREAQLLDRSGLTAGRGGVLSTVGAGGTWRGALRPGAADVVLSGASALANYMDPNSEHYKDGTYAATAVTLDLAAAATGQLAEKGLTAAGCAVGGPVGCVVGGAFGKVVNAGIGEGWSQLKDRGAVEFVDNNVTQPLADLGSDAASAAKDVMSDPKDALKDLGGAAKGWFS